MRLSELLVTEPGARWTGEDVEVLGLSAHSKEVKPGYLFAALDGRKACGCDFITEAFDYGAIALLAPSGARIPARAARLSRVIDDNPRRRLALMAARFYAEQPETVAAVTGTNGKTSVVSFTRQIWTRTGRRAASLGSLGVEACGYALELPHTTPEPVTLHRVLLELAQSGVDHLAIEASSHGLDQHRLDGVDVKAAAFTNITRDHLDYHASAEAYLGAKFRLFDTILAEGGTAVLNADVAEFEPLSRLCRARGHRVMSFGTKGRDLRLIGSQAAGGGQRLAIEIEGKRHEISTTLPGAFQAANLLAALGLTLACGTPLKAALAALPHLEGVRGRLQEVARHPSGAPIYVDYAHTPDALATVLRALRPYAGGRLVALFGCGGDRDPGKRPIMGEIARELADEVIVTDDNPRSEDAAAIRSEILAGSPGLREIGDRAEAIRVAIRELEAGDVLLLAGKGHERGQIVGEKVIPFDDADLARRAAAELGGDAR